MKTQNAITKKKSRILTIPNIGNSMKTGILLHFL